MRRTLRRDQKMLPRFESLTADGVRWCRGRQIFFMCFSISIYVNFKPTVSEKKNQIVLHVWLTLHLFTLPIIFQHSHVGRNLSATENWQ